MARDILSISLVHPDYLPPLYAIAQVLRDGGYAVHHFSFASPVPGRMALGPHIDLQVIGSHSGSAIERALARRRLGRTVARWAREHEPAAILAACPFSFLLGLRVRRPGIPLIYFAFEVSDWSWRDIARSPANARRNWRTFRRLRDADLVCAPSPERAGWLAGRARLDRVPITVLNAPYGGNALHTETHRSSLVPDRFRGRPIVIHTGNVSATQCVIELVESVVHWPKNACLIVTRVGDSDYAGEVRRRVAMSPRGADILLLPAVAREELLALQAEATIGVCLLREGDNLSSALPAPNKVGEYLHAGLLVLGARMRYFDQLERAGVAVLAETVTPEGIGRAVTRALERSSVEDVRSTVMRVARSWYRMDVQLQPVMDLLARRQKDRGECQ